MPKTQAKRCDECELLRINGLVCHETGCPNMGASWDADEGRWIKYRECYECGTAVKVGDACSCLEDAFIDETSVQVGSVVTHHRFGRGRVTAIDDRTYSIRMVTIKFDSEDMKVYCPAAEIHLS